MLLITARNSSCGKVMFSQASVIPSGGVGIPEAEGGGIPGGWWLVSHSLAQGWVPEYEIKGQCGGFMIKCWLRLV